MKNENNVPEVTLDQIYEAEDEYVKLMRNYIQSNILVDGRLSDIFSTAYEMLFKETFETEEILGNYVLQYIVTNEDFFKSKKRLSVSENFGVIH